MIKPFLLQRAALLFATTGVVLGLAGCSSQEPAASTPEQNKAFAGDPAIKERLGAQMRDKAVAGAAAASAAAAAGSVPKGPAK